MITHMTNPAPILRGRYRVDGLLARSELNTVFAATDLSDGTAVVLKVANEHCRDIDHHADTCYCLTIEAVLLRRLHRRGIPAPIMRDLFYADWCACLVMNRIDGLSLELLANSGLLSVPRALLAIDAVATTVAAVHALGIAHHDIKPANIVLPSRGPAILIDWGSAARLRLATERSRFVTWTREYTCIEQRLGQVLVTNDIYALGRTLAKVCRNPDAQIAAIIERATAPLGRRYPSVHDFRADLRQALIQ
jgi:eukaryotic-like serine/threonine-protein kinase